MTKKMQHLMPYQVICITGTSVVKTSVLLNFFSLRSHICNKNISRTKDNEWCFCHMFNNMINMY